MKTVVVTATLYRNLEELRFKLACKMVEKAISAGYLVVIVDSSPTKEVTNILSGLGAMVHQQQRKGMGQQRREAFLHAYHIAIRENIRTIVWVEPEKVDLIRSLYKLVEPLEEGVADIVIPCRSKASWQTWPEFQRLSEEKVNEIYNKLIGTKGFDPMFGPVAFNIEESKYFTSCNLNKFGIEDTYIQFYAPLVAKKDGRRLLSVEVDMIYPPEQKAEEEGLLRQQILLKRKWQRDTLTTACEIINSIKTIEL